MKPRAACVLVGLLSLVLSLVPVTVAQTTTETASALPRLVRFGGTVRDLNGNPLTGVVGVTFALYSEETGGAALWLETQNVTADSNGHYVALLGSTKPDGLPTDLFTTEQARWVGVQVSGQAEQPKVLLVSAPYALKAGDAETLGGKPASAYLLNPQQREGAPAPAQGNPAAASKAFNTDKSAVPATITGGGTTNYIPLWTTSSNLGNSIVYQSTTGLGIGTTSPLATLDIRKSTGMRAIASGNGVAVYGDATVASGTGKGVEGDSSSTSGTGVNGVANATTGSTQGVWGQSMSTSGTGVYGKASAISGKTFGVEGTILSSSGIGVQGDGNGIGVQGLSSSSTGTAGVFNNTAGGKVLSGQTNGTEVFSVSGSGVTQVGTQSATPAGILNATSTSVSYAGQVATGSAGTSSHGNGTDGIDAFGGGNGAAGAVGGAGVVGTGGPRNWPSSVGGNGVVGNAGSGGGIGVVGNGTSDADGYGTAGVMGNGGGAANLGGPGVFGDGAAGGGTNSPGGPGVYALGGAGVSGAGDGDGIFATNPDGGTASTGGYAGYFEGDINVTGTVYAGTKDFKIDHPTDPANKYLLHSSVESSEMMNIYSGNATLDGSGEAIVQLPTWFEAVNGDFRYQLTSIGAPGPGLYVAQEISGNRFKIAGGSAGNKVSWQVTAVRHDAYAKAYPLIVEQEKNAKERGYYVHPELYGAAKQRGVAWARYPEKVRQVKRKSPPQAPKLQQANTSSK